MSATHRLPAGTLLTVAQVAELAHREDHEVLTAIERRHLRAHKERGAWMVLVEDVRRWLSRH